MVRCLPYCTHSIYSCVCVDFALLNELIMFDVGETRATLSINITDDELVEPQESYIITLKSNEMTVSGEVVLTIIDDDSKYYV